MAVLDVEGVANSETLPIPLPKDGPRAADYRVHTLGYPAVQVGGSLQPALIKFLFQTAESGMIKGSPKVVMGRQGWAGEA